jgi:ACS family hexuronate transporter-like MFS transporter
MGGIGGMIMAKSTGLILDATNKNYAIIFAACTVVYFIAIIVIHVLSPRLERADLG